MLIVSAYSSQHERSQHRCILAVYLASGCGGFRLRWWYQEKNLVAIQGLQFINTVSKVIHILTFMLFLIILWWQHSHVLYFKDIRLVQEKCELYLCFCERCDFFLKKKFLHILVTLLLNIPLYINIYYLQYFIKQDCSSTLL